MHCTHCSASRIILFEEQQVTNEHNTQAVAPPGAPSISILTVRAVLRQRLGPFHEAGQVTQADPIAP